MCRNVKGIDFGTAQYKNKKSSYVGKWFLILVTVSCFYNVFTAYII